jgi:enoyl-CoA hydratase
LRHRWPARHRHHRPPRGATRSIPPRRALAGGFRRFDSEPSQRIAILTAADGAFCAGFDLREIAGGRGDHRAESGGAPMGPTRLKLSKPVIAAIGGPAVAGGLELALWCDLRVAARSATFGVYCRRFGVPLLDVGTIRLPRLTGHSRATDMILTGRGLSGEEAERTGLANRAVEPGRGSRRPSASRMTSPDCRRRRRAAIGCRRLSNGGSAGRQQY